MDTLTVQYIIIAAAVLAAGYSLYRTLTKAFRKSNKGGGCDNNCGCS